MDAGLGATLGLGDAGELLLLPWLLLLVSPQDSMRPTGRGLRGDWMLLLPTCAARWESVEEVDLGVCGVGEITPSPGASLSTPFGGIESCGGVSRGPRKALAPRITETARWSLADGLIGICGSLSVNWPPAVVSIEAGGAGSNCPDAERRPRPAARLDASPPAPAPAADMVGSAFLRFITGSAFSARSIGARRRADGACPGRPGATPPERPPPPPPPPPLEPPPLEPAAPGLEPLFRRDGGDAVGIRLALGILRIARIWGTSIDARFEDASAGSAADRVGVGGACTLSGGIDGILLAEGGAARLRPPLLNSPLLPRPLAREDENRDAVAGSPRLTLIDGRSLASRSW
jgi:hypothetical protein